MSKELSPVMIGAATIAIWFFIVDLYNGRPFYTPNVLGAALSLSRSIPDPAAAPISMELVVFYTWVHALIFCAFGGFAAKLLSLAERDLALWLRYFTAVRHL